MSDRAVRAMQKALDELGLKIDAVKRIRPLRLFSSSVSLVRETLWNEDDYRLAEQYAQRLLAGEKAPPIIVSGRTIQDGYHRLYAHQLARVPKIELVDMQEIYALLADQWE